MNPGKEIGSLLDKLLEMVIDGELENNKQALEAYAKEDINRGRKYNVKGE
jgi:hypothetical protein